MTKKQYAEYMLSMIIDDLQKQSIFADTWPEVAKAILLAKETAEHERNKL